MGTQAVQSEHSISRHGDCVFQAVRDSLGAACGMAFAPLEQGALGGVGPELIGASISLHGEVEWSVCLGLPKPTAEGLVAKFAGFPVPFDSEDMADAVGELANILAGGVKANLDQRGVKAEISLPQVVHGPEVVGLVRQGGALALKCFETEAGGLWALVVASSPEE